MMLFQWTVFLLACGVGLPLFFRLVELHPRLHTWPIIVMHAAMAFSVAWGGYRGWMQDADFGDVCSVIAPMLWLWISFGNWRDGVPPHYRKVVRPKPTPLPKIDDSMLSRVSGAGKK